MLLDELLGLMKPKTQSLAEVVVGNPLLAVEVDEVDFLGSLARSEGPLIPGFVSWRRRLLRDLASLNRKAARPKPRPSAEPSRTIDRFVDRLKPTPRI